MVNIPMNLEIMDLQVRTYSRTDPADNFAERSNRAGCQFINVVEAKVLLIPFLYSTEGYPKMTITPSLLAYFIPCFFLNFLPLPPYWIIGCTAPSMQVPSPSDSPAYIAVVAATIGSAGSVKGEP